MLGDRTDGNFNKVLLKKTNGIFMSVIQLEVGQYHIIERVKKNKKQYYDYDYYIILDFFSVFMTS